MIISVNRIKAFDKISHSLVIKICSKLSGKRLLWLDKGHLFLKIQQPILYFIGKDCSLLCLNARRRAGTPALSWHCAAAPADPEGDRHAVLPLR